ncbi:MAG TPA: hydrogenase iron-sulfur subunit [Anaerolineae bacterium]|nr:hydrogenase iron-sulfur subunit [Anaerolineae bacterium]
MAENGFEPRIIAFLCNWCTYAAADAAGISRMQQPLNVDVIRVMCSGRIDPSFVLKAFLEGADGVIVSGCHPPGDCHYGKGNYKTFRRMPLLERLLQDYGIEKERFHWGWISAAEAPKWAQLTREFTNRIKELGPLDWKGYLNEMGSEEA